MTLIMITCPTREPARNNGWGSFSRTGWTPLMQNFVFASWKYNPYKKNWTWYVRTIVQVNKPKQYCTLEINF